jgi:hypothetical protein
MVLLDNSILRSNNNYNNNKIEESNLRNTSAFKNTSS